MYANAVNLDLACVNTGASRPRTSPRSFSSHARSSTMAQAAASLSCLVTKHDHGAAVTHRKVTPVTPGSTCPYITNPDCSTGGNIVDRVDSEVFNQT